MTGRKRFVVTDTLGLPTAIQVVPASVQERDGGPPVIAEARQRAPGLALVWADSGFAGRCVETVRNETGVELQIVRRPGEGDKRRWTPVGTAPVPVPTGFQILPRRWVVERTFGWLGRYRRHARDWEATIASALGWIRIAFIRLLVQRFGQVGS